MTHEELERLANSEDWTDREKAAMDPECPPELLAKLAEDDDETVRNAAHEQLEQRNREYEAGLEAGGMGYGGGL